MNPASHCARARSRKFESDKILAGHSNCSRMNSDFDSEQTGLSSPNAGSESRGSSVSTNLRQEYEDLLRYAVVTPVIDLSTKALKSHSSEVQYHPSPVLPPRPQSPQRPTIQPEVSKVASDISDPSDLQQPQDDQTTPLVHPPPPFTAMNIQQKPIQANTRISHDSNFLSYDVNNERHDESMESYDQSTVRSPGADPEMMRLESQLNKWCLDLKRNILAEFEQSRLRLLERREAELLREKQQHTHDLQEARAQLEQFKELLATYEQSIGKKDHVIANLTRALQKQKERVDLQRSFGSWKLKHSEEKRESFTSKLAINHYNKTVKGRVWWAWFGLIQSRWKQRVEKACQSKAEEVCMQLTGEYEEQLEVIHRSLEESQTEVQQLKAERELYEENMKKSFMRGVCALNMEAMSMFRYRETNDSNCDTEKNCPTPEDSSYMKTNETPPITHNTPTHPPVKNVQVTTSTLASHMTRPHNHSTRNTGHITKPKRGPSVHRQGPEVVVQKH